MQSVGFCRSIDSWRATQTGLLRRAEKTEAREVLSPDRGRTRAPITEFKTALGATIGVLLNLTDDLGDPTSETAAGLLALLPPSMDITASEGVAAF